MRFVFNEGKASQAAAFLLRRHGNMTYQKLLALLYLADRQAFVESGYPITGARMVSMDNGPVLSELYSRITWGDDAESPWTDWISRKGPYQLSVRREDRQFLQLSEYDEEVLAGVLDKFGRWDAATLTRYTHALPEWRDPDGCALAIDLRLILQDAGKSDAEIHSIASQVESIWAMRRSQSLVG